MVPVTAPPTLLPEELYVRALNVGRRSAGVSGPNPPVGCVLVRDGIIVGEGSTGPVGGPHAEVVALDAAGEAAHGATAIVTLEPCAHQGRTAPCVDALLAAGVAEVHVLLRDPDPVAAGGLDVLARSGVRTVDVATVHAALAEAAAHDLRGFLTRVRHARPHVTLKLAQRVDGDTVPPAGAYLTGTAARSRVHRLRAESDAVLIGSGTLAADDPQLDVRLVDSGTQPRPVILASRADVAPQARAVRAGTLILVGPDAPSERRVALEAAGARVIEVALDATGGALDVAAALHALLDERILTVLAEPGLRLADALLAADVVDVVELHVAGGATPSDVPQPALSALTPLVALDATRTGQVERIMTDDGDLILRHARWAERHGRLEEVA